MTNVAFGQLAGLADGRGLANVSVWKELLELLDDQPTLESSEAGSVCEGDEKTKCHRLVDRRNTRERQRVENVNEAFNRLRRHIPYENRKKRLSKVKTLKTAMRYINYLTDLLHTSNKVVDSVASSGYHSNAWTSSTGDCDLNGNVTSHGLDTGYVVNGTLNYANHSVTSRMSRDNSLNHRSAYRSYVSSGRMWTCTT